MPPFLVAKTYQSDDNTRNFHANLDECNLQFVDEKIEQLNGTYSTSVHLEPNTMLPYIIEPAVKK